MEMYPTICRSARDAFVALEAIRRRDRGAHAAILTRAQVATSDALRASDADVRAVLDGTSRLPSAQQDRIRSLHVLYLEEEVNAYCNRWLRDRLRKDDSPPADGRE
jgi:hypothetical protein